MRNSWGFFRSVVILIISGSLLLTPVLPAYSRAKPDGAEDQTGAPAAPDGHPSKKVMTRLLPPGVPAPGPTHRLPAVVERHRDRQSPPVVREDGPRRPPPDRQFGSNRYDRNDNRPSRPDWRYDRGRNWHPRPDWRYDHSRDWRPRPHGSVHRSLPIGAFALGLAGAAVFFHMGTYYQQTPTGYVVVSAPYGARIRTLPESCLPVYIDGRRYYQCEEVYYQPEGDEYIVIERPSGEFQVVAEVGDEVQINAEVLNVRSGPGIRYATVGMLYRGNIVEVNDVDGDWYSVQLPNNQYGWIMREHATLYKTKNDAKG